MGPPDIGWLELLGGLAFVLAAQGISLVFGLGLVRDLAVGSLRTFAQLFIMGSVLSFIFAKQSFGLTGLVYAVMMVSAAQVVRGRLGKRSVGYLVPTAAAMFASYTLVSVIVSGGIVGAEPWWKPQVFLPLGGMVVGNTMSALAVSLERLFSELSRHRNLVEMYLAHGATPREAGAFALTAAARAGLTPAVTSLMGVGLVFLPGMMTGQILAGADPMTAIRYQIVVMLMIVGSTALATMGALLLVRGRCFDGAGRLKRGLEA